MKFLIIEPSTLPNIKVKGPQYPQYINGINPAITIPIGNKIN